MRRVERRLLDELYNAINWRLVQPLSCSSYSPSKILSIYIFFFSSQYLFPSYLFTTIIPRFLNPEKFSLIYGHRSVARCLSFEWKFYYIRVTIELGLFNDTITDGREYAWTTMQLAVSKKFVDSCSIGRKLRAFKEFLIMPI